MVITTTRTTGARSRITTQGQITVPKTVRDGLGVGPGDELEFERVGDHYLVRPRRRRSILEFAGIAGRATRRIPSTATQLDRLIDEGMATEAIARHRAAGGKARGA
jgi:AbrB family looped-hinge helix DNA binding protein